MVGTRKPLKIREDIIGSLILCVFLVFFIGFRPHSNAFGDTANFAREWGRTSWEGWTWDTENVIFDNLFVYWGTIFDDVTPIFLLCSAIYFSCILIACRKLFPANTLMIFLIYLAAFSSFSYGTNGIKAGAAGAIFLVALAYRTNLVVSIPLVLLSLGFHHSMQMPIAAYIITLVLKNKDWFFYGWLFCLAMAVLHVTFFQELFAGLSDSSGAGYLSNDTTAEVQRAKSGFRIDFIVYSAMPVVMGYFVKYKYQLKDTLYDILLNMYLTTNGVWMLCMYAEFTNRIAYLSWFMYPLVLVYPCYAIANERHPLVQNRKAIVLGHLGFTLFMTLIYY
ncbi:MAG: EpsG family protein [Bacteroidia bacterium]|nr:EpsG family protein [Bacteroidia bacterium]